MSASGWREFRVLIAFAVVGFALAAAVTVALSGGNARNGAAGSSGAATFTPVERAAYVTGRQPGFKFAMQLTGSAAGQTFTVGGTGSINPPGRGSLQMSVAGVSVSEVFAYPDVYIRMPQLSATTLAPTPWIKLSLTPVLQSTGATSSLGSSTDPSQLLDYLKASGSVALVGGEWVRGVATTHYHALVDLDRYPSVLPPNLRSLAQKQSSLVERMTGQSTLPFDVWIDGQRRVRRLAMQMSLCSPVGRISESLQMDLYDYGRQPPVTVPDPSQVTDLTSQLTGRMSHALQQVHCS
jgi:hypothetical protein